MIRIGVWDNVFKGRDKVGTKYPSGTKFSIQKKSHFSIL